MKSLKKAITLRYSEKNEKEEEKKENDSTLASLNLLSPSIIQIWSDFSGRPPPVISFANAHHPRNYLSLCLQLYLSLLSVSYLDALLGGNTMSDYLLNNAPSPQKLSVYLLNTQYHPKFNMIDIFYLLTRKYLLSTHCAPGWVLGNQ